MSALLDGEFESVWYFDANTASIVNYNISQNTVNFQFQAQNILDSTQTTSWKACEATITGDSNSDR
jgi:hypothetical protein